jgi:hypothetical protein
MANNAPRYAVTLHNAAADSVMLKLTTASGNAVALFTIMSACRVTPPSFMNDTTTIQKVSILYACQRAARYLASMAGSASPCAIESLFCNIDGIPQRNMTVRIPNEYAVPKAKRNQIAFA